MGFFGALFGFLGFGVGVSAGLVIGYYLFIYFQTSDIKVCACPFLVVEYFFFLDFRFLYGYLVLAFVCVWIVWFGF